MQAGKGGVGVRVDSNVHIALERDDAYDFEVHPGGPARDDSVERIGGQEHRGLEEQEAEDVCPAPAEGNRPDQQERNPEE